MYCRNGTPSNGNHGYYAACLIRKTYLRDNHSPSSLFSPRRAVCSLNENLGVPFLLGTFVRGICQGS